MRLRLGLAGAALLATAAPTVATAEAEPGPPDHVLALARGAAAETRGVALGLTEDIASTGEPQGRGSQAFADRHALLAAKHAAHPGNAAAVHAALAAGESPSSTSNAGGNGRGNGGTPPGQAKKGDGAALRGARARLEAASGE